MTRKTTRENAKRDRRRDQHIYVDDLRVGDVIYDKSGEATVVSVSDSDQRGYRNVEVDIGGGRKTFRYYGESTVPIKRRVPTARETGDAPNAEAAGEQYANDQLQGGYFMDWVREQMLEAERADPSQMLPLETKSDATVIAKNMLQQLVWDTERGLGDNDILDLAGGVFGPGTATGGRETVREFWIGFKGALQDPKTRDWLADELLQIKQEMRGGGVGEARRGVVAAPRRGSLFKIINVDTGQPIRWLNRRSYPREKADKIAVELTGRGYTVKIVPDVASHASEARRGAPASGPTTLTIDGGLEARRLRVGVPSKTLNASTETWVVHHPGEPGNSVLQVDIFKPQGRPWAAWTGNFTRARDREIAERVAAARNGTGVHESSRRHPKAAGSARRHSRSPTRRSRA